MRVGEVFFIVALQFGVRVDEWCSKFCFYFPWKGFRYGLFLLFAFVIVL